MKKFALIIFLTSGFIFAQQVKFAWITNITKAEEAGFPPDSLIRFLNTQESLHFVLISGQITENGKFSEYEDLKDQLDWLNHNYFLLPDVKDLKYGGFLNYNEFWYAPGFSQKIGKNKFLGITAENFLNDKKDNFTVETIDWLNNETSDTTLNYFLFCNNDLFSNYNNYEEILGKANSFNSFTLVSKNTAPSKEKSILSVGFGKKSDDFSINFGELHVDTLIISELQKKGDFRETYNTLLHQAKYNSAETEKFGIEKYEDLIFTKEFNSTLTAKPVYYNNRFYVCLRNGIINAVDTLGNVEWEYDSFGDIVSTPVIADNKLIVATRQGDLIMINTENGAPIETIGFDEYITSDLLTIEYTGDKQLFIEKQTNSKTAIILGTASGKIYCYDLETLQEYWVNDDCSDYITSPVLFDNDRIIVQSSGGEIYCIDAKRGWTIWKWNEATDKNKTVYRYKTILHDMNLFIASSSGYVYGIDLRLGKTKWRSDKFRSCNSIGLTPDKKKLLVKVYNEKLIVLSQKTGTNLNVLRYGRNYDNADANIFDNGKDIFITNNSGKVLRISNFKKVEKVLSLPRQLILDVLQINSNLHLVSTVNGLLVFTNFN